MSIFNFNKDTEKEVSSGVLIWYVLVGFAIAIILAFIAFVVVKKTSINTVETKANIEQSVDTSNTSTTNNR